MELWIGDVLVHYVEHGGDVPLVALHGAGVDHRDIEAAIEPVIPRVGYRRIYPDLPGMGRSTTDGPTRNDHVVALLGDFIGQLSEEPVMLLGHSYGGYLAGGVTAQRPRWCVAWRCYAPSPSGQGACSRRGGSPGRRRVRRTGTCAASGARRVLRRPYAGDGSPLPRLRRPG